MPDDFNPFQGDSQTGGTADWSNLFGNDTSTKTPTGQSTPTPASASDFKNMFGNATSEPAAQPIGDVTTPNNAAPTQGVGNPTELHPDNSYAQRMKPYEDYNRNRTQTEQDLQGRIARNEKLIKSFETPGFDINRPSQEEYHKAQQNNLAYRNQLTEIAKGRTNEAAIAQKAEQMGLRHPPGMGDEEFQQMVTEAIRNGDLHTYIVAAQDIDPKVRQIAELNQSYVAQKAATQSENADELLNKLTAASNVGPAAYDKVRTELASDPTTKAAMSFFGLNDLPKTSTEFQAERNKFTAAVNTVRGMARDYTDLQSRMTNGELVKTEVTDKDGKKTTTPEGKAADATFTFSGPGGATVMPGAVYRAPAPGGGTRLVKDVNVTPDQLSQIGKTVALTDKEDDKAVKEALQPHAKDIETSKLWAEMSRVVNDPRFAENPKMIMSYVDGSSRAKSGRSVNTGLLNATEALDATSEEISNKLHLEKSAVMNMLTGKGGARMDPRVLKFIQDDVGQQKNLTDKTLGSEIAPIVRQYMQRGGMLSNIGLPEDLQGPAGDAAREGNKTLVDYINNSEKMVNPTTGHLMIAAKGTPGGLGKLQPYAASTTAPGGAVATPPAAGGAAVPGPGPSGPTAPGAPPAGGGGTTPPAAPAPTGPVDPKNPTGGRNVNFGMPAKFADGTPPNDSAKAAQDTIVQDVGKAATRLGMTPTATNHVQALIAAAAEPSGYNTNADMGMFGNGRGDAAMQTNDRVKMIADAAAKDPALKAVLDNPNATPDQMMAALRNAGVMKPEREAAIRPALSRMLGVSAAAPGKPGALAEGPVAGGAAPSPAPDVSAARAAVPLPHSAPAPAGSVKRAYQDLGATPGELEVIHIESGFKNGQKTGSNVGHGQFSPDLMQRYGITNPDDPAQVLRGLRMERAEFEKAAGRPISDGEFYMSHQQGHAGGPALLRAASQAPDTPAWEAIRQYYPSTRVAKLAIWGNVPDNVKAQFGNVDNVSAKAFTDLWTSRFGGAAAGPRSGGGPVVNAPTAVPGGYDQPDLPRGPAPRSGGAMATPPAPQTRAPFAPPAAAMQAPSGGPTPAPEPVQPTPAPAAAATTPPASNAPMSPEAAQATIEQLTKAGIPVPPQLAAMAKPQAGDAATSQKAALDKFNARFVPMTDDLHAGVMFDTETGKIVNQDEMAELGKQFLLNLHPAIRGAAQGYANTPEGAGAVTTAYNMAAGAGRESLNAATLGLTGEGFMHGAREGYNSGESIAGKLAKGAMGAASDVGDFLSVVPVGGTIEGLVGKGIGAAREMTAAGKTAADTERAAAATLAKGRPPIPTKEELASSKAGTANKEVQDKIAAHADYERALAHAKATGKDPAEMVYAHNVDVANKSAASGTEKTTNTAVAARPQEIEKAKISADYEGLHRGVGETDAPVLTRKLKDGPVSNVRSKDNPGGTVHPDHAGDAVDAENRITAPIASVRQKWLADPQAYHTTKQEIGRMTDVELKSRDLQMLRSEYLDRAAGRSADGKVVTPPSAKEADAMNAIADNIRKQQEAFYRHVVYPDPKDAGKADAAIAALRDADKRYAQLMAVTGGKGNIVDALTTGDKASRAQALEAYVRFARGETKDAKGNIVSSGAKPDLDAIKAARMLAKGGDESGAWWATKIGMSKAATGAMMLHFDGAAYALAAGAATDIGRAALRRFTTLKAAGSPATFSTVVKSETKRYLTQNKIRPVSAATQTATGRTAAPAAAPEPAVSEGL